MSGVGVRFGEEMGGYVGFGERGLERGAAAGRAVANRLTLRLAVEIDDLARFAADPNRAARLSGWVEWEALGGRLAIERGVFNLLVGEEGADRKRMRYRLVFADGVGHPVTLVGEKLVGGSGRRVWAETTTLYVRVLRGGVEEGGEGGAELVASGIVRLRPIGFARQLTTFRATGGSRAARIGAIARFDALFARLLWRAYGPAVRRRVRARLAAGARSGWVLGALRRGAKGPADAGRGGP